MSLQFGKFPVVDPRGALMPCMRIYRLPNRTSLIRLYVITYLSGACRVLVPLQLQKRGREQASNQRGAFMVNAFLRERIARTSSLTRAIREGTR